MDFDLSRNDSADHMLDKVGTVMARLPDGRVGYNGVTDHGSR